MIPREVEAICLLGWRVYPASRRTKAACFRGATDAATYDLNIVARWCSEYMPCNWRVVMQGSGVWALDLDVPSANHTADGVKALAELVKVHGPIPPRPMTRSGGGGYGIFFKHSGEPIAGATGTPAPGIDPRRGRLSITVPPSVHITTRRPYAWLVEPWKVSPPAAPAWLLRLVAPPPEPKYSRPVINTTDAARRRLYRAALVVAEAGEGTRNDVLNRRAYQVGRMIGGGLLGEQEAAEALYAAARQAGLPHPEARATIVSGINSGVRRGADGR